MKNEGIISSSAECTIRQFMRCAFEEKYRCLLLPGAEATDEELKTAFEIIYAEYVDYAGLYQNREFEICAYINSLDNRMQVTKRFTEMQRIFIDTFDAPYIPGFAIVKKYGHNLYWDFERPDKAAFLKKLQQIDLFEKRFTTEIDKKIHELVELRKKKEFKEYTVLETRKEFISMLNRLQQARFVIDKDKTSVEELSLMIRDLKDQQDEDRIQRSFKRK